MVHGAARVAEEDLADGRRLPPEQPVHVPGDGEALRVLRDDAPRPAGARDVADPAQEPSRERSLPADRRALQPPVRPGRDRRPDRLPAVHEALRRRSVGRGHAHPRPGRTARRLRRVGRAADAPAGGGGGLRRLRAEPLDRRGDDGDALRARPADARPLPGRPRLPLAGARRRGGDDQQARQRLLPLGVQLLRDDRQGRARVPDRLRERLAGRRAHEPALLLPVGDPRARPLERFCTVTGRPMRINQSTRDYFEAGDRDDLSYEEKLAAYRVLADDYFQIEEYEAFCAEHLPHLEEALLEYVGGPEFDRLLVDTVQSTFPAHEHEHFTEHFRGLLASWTRDSARRERARGEGRAHGGVGRAGAHRGDPRLPRGPPRSPTSRTCSRICRPDGLHVCGRVDGEARQPRRGDDPAAAAQRAGRCCGQRTSMPSRPTRRIRAAVTRPR